MAIGTLNKDQQALYAGLSASNQTWNIQRSGWYRVRMLQSSSGVSNLSLFVRGGDYEYAYNVRPPFNLTNGQQYSSTSDDTGVYWGIQNSGNFVKNLNAGEVYLEHYMHLEQGNTLVCTQNAATIYVDFVGFHCPVTTWHAASPG